MKSTEEIISELKELVHTEGYIYSLCLILYEDFYFDLNKIHEVDPKSKISVKECSLIVGLLVQKKIDLTYPKSPDATFALKEQTYALMRELQTSFNAALIPKFKEIMERQERGENIEDERQDRLDFFVKDKGMVEPMFYAGDGVYDFQYLEYLERKYRHDKDWLAQNRQFDIDKTKEIVNQIKQILRTKGQKVTPANLKNVFPEIAAKARKKLKKQFSSNEIDEMLRKQLIAATYYQFVRLFPAPEDVGRNNSEGWIRFYENLIDLFIITPSDLQIEDSDAINSFFKNFSFTPPCNDTYEGPGYFNVLNSRPIIQLSDARYFVPVNFLIAEAIYESPFYWMWDDSEYRDTLAKNRGDAGEEIAYDFLSRVFGEKNTFKSINIETKKGHRKTDIDVICLLGNKALCVQVKSKKLTLTAKRGNFDQLLKDFKGAVQDAYGQGLVSRDAILNKTARFFDKNKQEIFFQNELDEVYIMGLTTENYPALVHQTQMMLVKESKDPYPLFISIFDLELLVHYLNDPYDFLYYVRQRINLMDYFKADEELVYLGYHLKNKLWKVEGSDWGMIDNNYGAIVDRNYYPYKIGVSHLLSEDDDPLSNRWKDANFDALATIIKSSSNPKSTDIIFHLLDLSGSTRTEIVEHMIKFKKVSQTDKLKKSIATANAPDFGISYVVLNSADPEELTATALGYAELRKYSSKCNAWLGMGSFSHSPNLVDCFFYNDELWQVDNDLENQYGEVLSKFRKTPFTPMKGSKKVGRNDPCPCKSGKKYKKCCGQ